MKQYIGTKIIQAEPQEKDGKSGYKVRYPDGYESWSPDYAFNEAYRLADGMTFGLAMEAMKKGFKVARPGWNGNGMFLQIQKPDENSKMTHPYLYITVPECIEGTRLLPWQPAQVDIFADDWEILSSQ